MLCSVRAMIVCSSVEVCHCFVEGEEHCELFCLLEEGRVQGRVWLFQTFFGENQLRNIYILNVP